MNPKLNWTLRADFIRPPSAKPAMAFTLTELLVVVAILALVVATQLPALTRAKGPARFTQCQNNLRRMGQATLLYKDDNHDAFPFGNRITGPDNGSGSVVDPNGWPMQLLKYLGGAGSTNQPRVFLCPNETGVAANWVFQMHYQVSRVLFSDYADTTQPVLGSQVRKPAIFWMFIEKGPAEFCNIRPGGLANPILVAWNYPPGSPGYRRHHGGLNAAAADGHVEWLRLPLYQPGRPPPTDFLELGDCANGQNPGSTWPDSGRVKLYSRYSSTPSPGAF